MRRTTLRDPENNKRVKEYENGKLLRSEVISSIEFRIEKHLEFIKREYKTIKDNIGFSNIIEDSLIRIKSREDKIDELNEFLEHCL